MTRLIYIYLFLLCVNSLLAQYCTDDNRFTEIEYFDVEQIAAFENVTYALVQDPYDPTISLELHLDVYGPKISEDELELRPFVLFVHGGALTSGTRESWRQECIEFAKRGFVAATITYRLGKENDDDFGKILRIYRARQDAHAAMRYIVHKAEELAIDTSWMFLGGGSAGSHICHDLIYADQEEYNNKIPNVVDSLGTIVDSGNDLMETFSIKGLFNNCGSVLGSYLDVEELIPTIAFHKEFDHVVAIDTNSLGKLGSRAMHAVLENNGVCSQLTVDPNPIAEGDPHCPYTSIEGELFRVTRAICFFKSIFCDDCITLHSTALLPATCSTLNSTNSKDENSTISVHPNPFFDSFSISHCEQGTTFKFMNTSGLVYYEGQDISDQIFTKLSS
ncbi:MAG: alpha/beta hydrolase, partial [Saprospiraceae bacterium]|nr:alpha/beta hydrolase [Saprospiraceae bacterium]